MDKSKKNILLVIRRGASELEWIAPVIKNINFRFNLYTFYLSESSYKSCVADKISSSIIKKYQKKQFIQKKENNLILKIIRKLLPKKFFFKQISELIHDTKYLKLKLSIKEKEKIDIVLTEFGNYSFWLNSLKKKEKSKIIHYPSTPATYIRDKGSKIFTKKLPGDFLIVNSKKDVNYWSNFIKKEKIYYFGVPIFEKSWQTLRKKSEKPFFKKSGEKIVLFAYSSYFGQVNKYEFEILEKQLNQIMQAINRFKNIKVFFKIHPHKNDKHFLKIINNFSKNLRNLTKKDLYFCASECDCVISNFQSAASLYGTSLKKPSIEMWRGINSIYKTNVSYNSRLGLIENTKNLKDFEKKLNLAVYKPNNVIWKNKYRNFNNLYLNNNTKFKIAKFIKKCSEI